MFVEDQWYFWAEGVAGEYVCNETMSCRRFVQQEAKKLNSIMPKLLSTDLHWTYHIFLLVDNRRLHHSFVCLKTVWHPIFPGLFVFNLKCYPNSSFLDTNRLLSCVRACVRTCPISFVSHHMNMLGLPEVYTHMHANRHICCWKQLNDRVQVHVWGKLVQKLG